MAARQSLCLFSLFFSIPQKSGLGLLLQIIQQPISITVLQIDIKR
jgi:hypothetical protein